MPWTHSSNDAQPIERLLGAVDNACRQIPMEPCMTLVGRILDSIRNYRNEKENRRREAFLARAESVEDLERRMRILDAESNYPVL